MNTKVNQNNEITSIELVACINKFNHTLCREKKIEIVHEVYNLGFPEIAEALGASIYGQTVNLKYLLGDYEVSEENNYAKPKQKNNLWKFVLTAIISLLMTLSNAQTMSLEKVDNQLHLALGMVSGSGAIMVNEKALNESIPNSVVAIGSAFAIGFVKEVYDANQPNNKFNWAELAWTTIGGAVSYGLHELGVPDYITFGVGLGYAGIRMSF